MLAARIVPQRVHIAHAIGNVVAISPHAIERKVFDGSALPAGLAFRRYIHLNNRALLYRYIFEGPKDAVLILSGDRHNFRLTDITASSSISIFAPIVAFWWVFSGTSPPFQWPLGNAQSNAHLCITALIRHTTPPPY